LKGVVERNRQKETDRKKNQEGLEPRQKKMSGKAKMDISKAGGMLV